WLGAGRGAGTPLREVWLIDGVPGDEAAGAPALLAPDETRGRPPRFVNTWIVAPGESRLLVCIYGGGVWLRAVLPSSVRRCTQTGDPQRMAMRCE
ncbi:STY0301 family protein, partial [Falsiroseomonas oryzae]|uniref:STY0301 family protein n=1 Tax=Falsiroseomonas oryzae TaxID=2766473 RepID=UPI0022EB43C4